MNLPTDEITPQQIMDWMLAKAAPIMDADTNYIQLACVVVRSYGATSVKFRCAELGDVRRDNSYDADTPEAAIAMVLEGLKPSKAIAHLRQQAAELTEKANILERKCLDEAGCKD